MSTLREYPRFSESEYGRRYAAIRRMMTERSLDLLVIYGNSSNSLHGHANVHYVSNLLARHDAYVIFPAQGEPALLVEGYNHLPNAKEISVIKETEWAGPDPSQSVSKQIITKGYEKGQIGVVGRIPYQVYQHLMKELPNARFTDATSAFGDLRLVKSEEELEWIKIGAAFTDRAMEALERHVRPGMREYELARIINDAYLGDGGQYHFHYLASTPMSESTVCVPAQHLSSRVIERGDVIITEVSASWWGYSGQIHRPLAVGVEPTHDYQELYEIARETYSAISNAIRAGADESAVLDAADIIDKSGFTIYDTLVHGFGVDLQPPDIRTRKTSHHPLHEFVFRENMTFVIQPNVITKDERKGIQLGNLMLVTQNGSIPLQKYPIKFVLCS